MNIIILGAPGSGKGTQANLLAKELNLFHFDAGTLARELAKTDPRIDRIVNKKGELIPEKEMTDYVTTFLNKHVPEYENILFEGYPRFVTQYQSLKKLLAVKGKKIDAVIYLHVDEDKIIKRLSSRRLDIKTGEIYNLITNPPPSKVDGKKLVHRDDDKPAVIKERFERFRENVLPLVEVIKSEGNLLEIDGDKPIEDVFKQIKERLQL